MAKEKTSPSSFSVTAKEREIILELSKELGINVSRTIVVSCFFLHSTLQHFKKGKESKVLDFKKMVASFERRPKQRTGGLL